jgi:hypothetical protein
LEELLDCGEVHEKALQFLERLLVYEDLPEAAD